MNKVLAILAAALFLIPLASCSSNSSNAGSAEITVAGSTALLPLVKQAAQDYQAAHSDVKISVSGGGSRVGLTQAEAKGVDIGDSDIPSPAGQDADLVDHKVAVVTFAVVTHPNAGVKNLTKAQIQDIFSGKISNWKQAGGADQKIVIINRPKSSGTRAVFVAKLMNNAQPVEGLTEDSSGTVVTTVAQTPGAVSYVSTAYLKQGTVTATSIEGVSPSDANVTSGKYPFWSYEHMYTNGQPSKAVAAFVDYVGNDGALLKKLGFIPVKTMKVK